MGRKRVSPLSAPLSREEAIEKGLRRFNTGRPCAKGHYADRQTTNGGCIACMRPVFSPSNTGGEKFGTYWDVPRPVTPEEAAYLIKLVQWWLTHIMGNIDAGTAVALPDGTPAPSKPGTMPAVPRQQTRSIKVKYEFDPNWRENMAKLNEG